MTMHAQRDILLVPTIYKKLPSMFLFNQRFYCVFGSWHSNEMVHKASVMFALCFVIIIAPTVQVEWNGGEENVGWPGGKRLI